MSRIRLELVETRSGYLEISPQELHEQWFPEFTVEELEQMTPAEVADLVVEQQWQTDYPDAPGGTLWSKLDDWAEIDDAVVRGKPGGVGQIVVDPMKGYIHEQCGGEVHMVETVTYWHRIADTFCYTPSRQGETVEVLQCSACQEEFDVLPDGRSASDLEKAPF